MIDSLFYIWLGGLVCLALNMINEYIGGELDAYDLRGQYFMVVLGVVTALLLWPVYMLYLIAKNYLTRDNQEPVTLRDTWRAPDMEDLEGPIGQNPKRSSFIPIGDDGCDCPLCTEERSLSDAVYGDEDGPA